LNRFIGTGFQYFFINKILSSRLLCWKNIWIVNNSMKYSSFHYFKPKTSNKCSIWNVIYHLALVFCIHVHKVHKLFKCIPPTRRRSLLSEWFIPLISPLLSCKWLAAISFAYRCKVAIGGSKFCDIKVRRKIYWSGKYLLWLIRPAFTN